MNNTQQQYVELYYQSFLQSLLLDSKPSDTSKGGDTKLSAASFARALRNEYLCGWLFDPVKIKEKLPRRTGLGNGLTTPSKEDVENPFKSSKKSPSPQKVAKGQKKDAKDGQSPGGLPKF